jgi:NAD(P)-dependent dehydrogenase (short-subunit alcohol dehydrogenase family)
MVAFITGGTRGIGLGIAEHLITEGYDLAINGVRNFDEVADIVAYLKSKGRDVIYCQGSVADLNNHQRFLEEICSHYGRIDVLVNNAGVAPKERKDILETTPESFDYVVDTNLKATFFLTQLFANKMIEQIGKLNDYRPSIVNITSVSATVASVNRGEYCISKAGMSMSSQLFATRLAQYGIQVFEVRPGIIKTDMTEKVSEKYTQLFKEGLALQNRWGQPDDIGKAVAALVGGSFPYSTGSVFTVDGGLTVARL